MQFNNGTDAVVADIHFLCNTNAVSYPIAAMTRNVNRWAYKAHIAQIKANHRWQIDDYNLTTLPHLTTTLVAEREDYEIPTGFLKINRLEVKDAQGDYQKLIPIDQSDIKGAYTEFEETSGLPKYYDIVGNSLILMPKPAAADITTTEGLRIHILREIDIFTTADTTQEPGFPEAFHRIVVYGACYDFMSRPNGDKEAAQTFRSDAEMLLKDMSEFTAHMQGDEHIRIKSAHKTNTYIQ